MIVKSLEHLNQISKTISQKLENGDCIFLIGEIGVGKTTFTKYLINNLQIQKGLKETEVLDFNHTYTFTILVYSYVFFLWFLWATKLSSNQANDNDD